MNNDIKRVLFSEENRFKSLIEEECGDGDHNAL